MTTANCIIRVPAEQQQDFRAFWKDLRISDGLPPNRDLNEAANTENFDGASMAEWVIPLIAATLPLITAALGYLIARRGEIEIPYKRGGGIIKMKNMTPSQLAQVIEVIEDHEDGST